MYRFQHIEYLWLLLLVPAATAFYIIYLKWRSAGIAKLGAYDLVMGQLSGRIGGRLTTKFVLAMLAFICAVLGLANLQKGAGTETAERKGIDVIFALDVSKSMLAKDIQPDRLTRSKQLIERMMDKMKNDRVGLVVFAGRAYLQTPLTVDYSAVKMLLSSVGPDMVPTQGTVLAEAIDLSDKSFSEKEKKHKALVLISDGEDHDEEATGAAKRAAEQGVIIHTVGVGSPEGATIIDPASGKEKLDEEGKPVITKLNEPELQGIAQAGGGGYQHLDNANAVADNISDAINNIESRNMGAVIFTQYKSYFQYFIAIAVLLLVIEWLIPSSRMAGKNKTLTVKAGAILIMAFFFSTACLAQEKDDMKARAAANDQIYKGNQLYRDKKYKEATDAYNEAMKHDPASLKGKYNSGNALYNTDQYDKAGEQFTAVAENSKNKAEKAKAFHNLGNSYMKQQKWQEAVDALKQSLKLNPADNETRYNLAYAQEKLKQQNKDNKNNKDKNKQDKKDNKDNKDKKDNKDNKDDKGGDKPKEDKGDKDKKDNKDGQDKKDDKGSQQPQAMPSKLSEKQAENLLNALRQEEKKLQDKKNKERGVPVRLQKDW